MGGILYYLVRRGTRYYFRDGVLISPKSIDVSKIPHWSKIKGLGVRSSGSRSRASDDVSDEEDTDEEDTDSDEEDSDEEDTDSDEKVTDSDEEDRDRDRGRGRGRDEENVDQTYRRLLREKYDITKDIMKTRNLKWFTENYYGTWNPSGDIFYSMFQQELFLICFFIQAVKATGDRFLDIVDDETVKIDPATVDQCNKLLSLMQSFNEYYFNILLTMRDYNVTHILVYVERDNFFYEPIYRKPYFAYYNDPIRTTGKLDKSDTQTVKTMIREINRWNTELDQVITSATVVRSLLRRQAAPKVETSYLISHLEKIELPKVIDNFGDIFHHLIARKIDHSRFNDLLVLGSLAISTNNTSQRELSPKSRSICERIWRSYSDGGKYPGYMGDPVYPETRHAPRSSSPPSSSSSSGSSSSRASSSSSGSSYSTRGPSSSGSSRYSGSSSGYSGYSSGYSGSSGRSESKYSRDSGYTGARHSGYTGSRYSGYAGVGTFKKKDCVPFDISNKSETKLEQYYGDMSEEECREKGALNIMRFFGLKNRKESMRRLLVYHPDKLLSETPEIKALYEKYTRYINSARSYLDATKYKTQDYY